jgi:hypothetical protein
MRLPRLLLIAVLVPLVAVGGTASAGSTVEAPGKAAPANVSAPTVSGNALQGQTISASIGSWSGPSATYTLQWQRCDASGGACGPTGAGDGSYGLGSTDVGSTLRVMVTATNKNGSSVATSAATPVVAAPPATTTPPPTTTTTPPATTTTPPATTTTPPATTTTTPAPGGTVYFDGRAKNMTTLYSYETTPGNINTLLQGQSPQIWDCLCFLNNDMSLAADSRYGKVDSIHAGPGSHNPWNTAAPAGYAAALVSKRRPNNLGKWDWFANAYKIPSGWTQPDFALLTEFEYATLSSPPLAIDVYPINGVPHYVIYRNAGKLTNNGSGWYGGTVQETRPIVAVPYGKWVDIIVGVKWANDTTGELRVYARVEGQSSYTLVLTESNTPTWQYGTTSYTTVNADGTDTSGHQVTVIDNTGLYTGYYDSRTSFPTNTVYASGLTRSSDLATATATLP